MEALVTFSNFTDRKNSAQACSYTLEYMAIENFRCIGATWNSLPL